MKIHARLNRRQFVRLGAGAAALGAIANPFRLNAAALPARAFRLPLGLQLYSVREQLAADFDGTLAKLSAAGYTVVEAAGYHGRSPQQFRHAMDKAGVRCVSTHHTLSQLRSQLSAWIEYGQTLGLEYVVCSSSSGVHRNPAAGGEPTLDDWRFIADEFNRIGASIRQAGMRFGVHNHTPELATLGGVKIYDELLRRTNPDQVDFEMDAGWVHASGHDPVGYLTKTPARFPLMHIKDMVPAGDSTQRMTVLGKGSIDYAPILRAATGLRYAFVEQETYEMDPFEELRLDAAYLHDLSFPS